MIVSSSRLPHPRPAPHLIFPSSVETFGVRLVEPLRLAGLALERQDNALRTSNGHQGHLVKLRTPPVQALGIRHFIFESSWRPAPHSATHSFTVAGDCMHHQMAGRRTGGLPGPKTRPGHLFRNIPDLGSTQTGQTYLSGP